MLVRAGVVPGAIRTGAVQGVDRLGVGTAVAPAGVLGWGAQAPTTRRVAERRPATFLPPHIPQPPFPAVRERSAIAVPAAGRARLHPFVSIFPLRFPPSAGRRSWREKKDGQRRSRRLTETRGPLEAELCGDSGRLSLPRRRPSASRLPSLGKRLARHLPMFGKKRADLPNIGKIPLALRATRGPAAPQRGDGAEKGDPACGITEKRAFWARFPFRTMTFRARVTR